MSITGADKVEEIQAKLAVYGSLAPGKPNYGRLEGLRGNWSTGTVRGRLIQEGWGAAMGYPGLILDMQGEEIEVSVFESPDLASAWDGLDAFEGPDYVRVVTYVLQEGSQIPAHIYVLALLEISSANEDLKDRL